MAQKGLVAVGNDSGWGLTAAFLIPQVLASLEPSRAVACSLAQVSWGPHPAAAP